MSPDHLSTTFAALADPTRRAILSRLSLGELSVTELAEPFEMSMPAVSKHLKVLERAGLIARSREAQWRRCRLDAAPLREVSDWLDDYRTFWEQSLDRLDAYLTQIQAQTQTKPQMTPTPKPQMAQTPKLPQMTPTPKPQMAPTPKPEMAQAQKPQMAQTPKPPQMAQMTRMKKAKTAAKKGRPRGRTK